MASDLTDLVREVINDAATPDKVLAVYLTVDAGRLTPAGEARCFVRQWPHLLAAARDEWGAFLGRRAGVGHGRNYD